ncbi:hypothetical protein [Streptomyces sp. NPDC001380]|uniref:hypothetical protein n=1 Tax=Streptomyces sp. NPDC001380 TaxID=3364566 RepID=UPI00367D4DD0
MYGPQPGTSAPYPAPPGPSRPAVRALWALLPVLTCGVLAFGPALYLAVRRGRPRDWAGAAFFTATAVTLCLCAVLGGSKPKGAAYGPADYTGITMMVVGLLLAPVHFLVMDRPREWQAAAPRPAPWTGGPAPYPLPPQPGHGYPQVPPPYTPTAHRPQPQPYSGPLPYPGPAAPQPPAPPAPAPGLAPAPVADGGDAAARAELRELGELLRRQAADGDPGPGPAPAPWRDGPR